MRSLLVVAVAVAALSLAWQLALAGLADGPAAAQYAVQQAQQIRP